MALSLGKRFWRTKAWNTVATRRDNTVKAAIKVSPIESDLVNQFDTFIEYLIVAVAAAVIGNVYAHQASENLLNGSDTRHHMN